MSKNLWKCVWTLLCGSKRFESNGVRNACRIKAGHIKMCKHIAGCVRAFGTLLVRLCLRRYNDAGDRRRLWLTTISDHPVWQDALPPRRGGPADIVSQQDGGASPGHPWTGGSRTRGGRAAPVRAPAQPGSCRGSGTRRSAEPTTCLGHPRQRVVRTCVTPPYALLTNKYRGEAISK